MQIPTCFVALSGGKGGQIDIYANYVHDHACFVNADFSMHFKHVIALHLTQRPEAAIETASNKASCHLQKIANFNPGYRPLHRIF